MDAIVNTKGLTNPGNRLDFNPVALRTGSGLASFFPFINDNDYTHPHH